MIVVDSSALVAVLLREPGAAFCETVLASETDIAMAAPTYVESLIVAIRRNIAPSMRALMDEAGVTIHPVDREAAARAAEAYLRWGKGRHAARLNFGDVFSYELAQRLGCPLLYVGNDFAATDIRSVLAR